VEEALNVKYLSKLDALDLFTLDTEQRSPYHKKWYQYVADDGYNSFLMMYRNFIVNHVVKYFDEPIIYQTKPTFRVCLNGNKAVTNWHKDSQYNHHIGEINFFLPVTTAIGNNSIWIESEEDKGDYAPIYCEYGDCVIFPGATHTHGNKLNDTGKTRVSFDFRILPKRLYTHNDRTTKVQSKRMIIGDYWAEI